ncbi:MAG: hypothetical protein COU90_02815 [Candidatus Ryanbacteria bacterium CG10_big_fil_rev_8_21_14_0_10_43_42]|uniref:Uncharacterized protein n=1 Tax=Candidatus Ryanbacteria bacterium CG10_big_fil_rev_8_21_14_0_10_43_42 TaxID=1974864 RepID=A0A2M8KWR2_9BACT|nr:MAG: hypothetical protein COU90_02815 [Candidatus Ryanbacteria bacterium CG10_big_fil_rev_8_21_14_0_10_43_42]
MVFKLRQENERVYMEITLKMNDISATEIYEGDDSSCRLEERAVTLMLQAAQTIGIMPQTQFSVSVTGGTEVRNGVLVTIHAERKMTGFTDCVYSTPFTAAQATKDILEQLQNNEVKAA